MADKELLPISGLPRIAAGFAPGVGQALAVDDIQASLRDKDMLGTGLGLLGLVPVLGGAAKLAKTARAASKVKNAAQEIKAVAEPFQNVVHGKTLSVGRVANYPGAHVTEPGYAYRSLSQNEIDDILKNGVVRSNPAGKAKGGRKNVKHWSAGDGQGFFRPDQDVIRVRREMLKDGEMAPANIVEVWDKANNVFVPLKNLLGKARGGMIENTTYSRKIL